MNNFANRRKLKNEAWKEFIAGMFSRNANHARFSKMLLEFCKACANNENKYPKDLSTMINVTKKQQKCRKELISFVFITSALLWNAVSLNR